MQEQTSQGGKEGKILIAEFENFATPVCQYLKEERVDHPELDIELLEADSGTNLLSCTSAGSVQRVEATKANQFLWPELTGKLRVGVE